jgi:hypothetical protein
VASTGAAVGQATQNTTYLGQRLLYEKVPEGSFDPLGNSRYMLYMLRQAGVFWAIYTILWWLFAVPFFFITLISIASSANQAAQNGGTPSLGGSTVILGLWQGGAALAALAFVVVFLLIPIPVQLSEWKFLVEDKGAARPMVFDHVAWAFRRRNTPVESMGVRRLTQPGGLTRDYLEVRQGNFTGLVSCFEQGNDLYVGWTLWLNMAPWRWFLMRVERIFQEVTQKANEMYITLRYEPVKAMRESMHSAAREGIDVATDQLEAQGQGIAASLPVSTSGVGR